MTSPDEAVKEVTRSVKELGARVFSFIRTWSGRRSMTGIPAVFEEAARLDVPICCIRRVPQLPGLLTEKKSKYEIWWTLGCLMNQRAMARMVFSGIYDKFPS